MHSIFEGYSSSNSHRLPMVIQVFILCFSIPIFQIIIRKNWLLQSSPFFFFVILLGRYERSQFYVTCCTGGQIKCCNIIHKTSTVSSSVSGEIEETARYLSINMIAINTIIVVNTSVGNKFVFFVYIVQCDITCIYSPYKSSHIDCSSSRNTWFDDKCFARSYH